MKDLSLHIMDIVQNSISAKATIIEITIEESQTANTYIVRIKDNGKGMSSGDGRKSDRPICNIPDYT